MILGDNRKVDFSRAIIFMASPRFGFGASEQAEQIQSEAANADLDDRIVRAGLAAARGRFTPEFINRLDKIVTFKPLRSEQLSQILDIESNSTTTHFQR